MRLAQLARKLSLKSAEIHAFLSERGHTLELNPNTRLSDEQVLLAIRHFNPSQEVEIAREQAPLVEAAEDVVSGPVVEEESPDEPVSEESVAAFHSPADADAGPEAEPAVIRAPKAELPGLRVVGKIELKEARKKEVPTAADSAAETPEPKTSPTRRETRPQRTWKNPLEVQRQREAREREEKREREIEQEKLRRTQKYLKKVKSAPTKRVRREEDNEVEIVEDTRPAPKTWLGKFARWLTT